MLSSTSASTTDVILLTDEPEAFWVVFVALADLGVLLDKGRCDSFLAAPFAAAADLNGL